MARGAMDYQPFDWRHGYRADGTTIAQPVAKVRETPTDKENEMWIVVDVARRSVIAVFGGERQAERCAEDCNRRADTMRYKAINGKVAQAHDARMRPIITKHLNMEQAAMAP